MKITSLSIGSETAEDGRDILACRVSTDEVGDQACAGLGLTTDGGKWSTPDAVAKTLEMMAASIRRMEDK